MKDKTGNIDYIFSHGEEILGYFCGPWVQTLARNLGVLHVIDSLDEEDIQSYVDISLQIQKIAEPFLKTNDKAGWMDFCSTHKVEIKKRLP